MLLFLSFFVKNIMRGMHANQDNSELYINSNFFCVFLFRLIHIRVSINAYAMHNYGEAAVQIFCMS